MAVPHRRAGRTARPLVPDVAFVRYDRLRGLSDEDVEVPPFAPDVAIEILSPGDRAIDVDSTIDVYLRGCGSLVLVIDPKRRTISAAHSETDRTPASEEIFTHAALPGFTLAVGPFFESVLRRQILTLRDSDHGGDHGPGHSFATAAS